MAMNYKAFQSVLENQDGEKLWYPVLVKDGGVITLEQIAKRVAEKSSLTEGDVYNSVRCLIGEMNDKLMNGHSVRLDGLGSFTTIAKAGGNGVKTPQEVNASQIKTLRIQFTPTYKRTPMQGITRALFDGVEFQRWIGDPYHPQYKAPGGNTPGGGSGGGQIDPDA